ncbi:MAG TPA: hypothetical protein PLL71_01270 [Agriterribacter sp.]|nr:hypothetical protein [Agriterribacter sp.]HRQ50339.1 hypothetical protein [Agriterribacter sp.]
MDLNKDISSISYNHLNLPEVVTVADKGMITYTYNAAGNKIKKQTVETGATVTYNGTPYPTDIITTTYYTGGFVYESKSYNDVGGILNPVLGYSDRLQLVGHEEGRIRALYDPSSPNTLTGFAYDYFIKDHLGNPLIAQAYELMR